MKRLLELLSSYSYNLYYIKGKDMILHDILSRQKDDDSNPHEMIQSHLICKEYYKINIIMYKI